VGLLRESFCFGHHLIVEPWGTTDCKFAERIGVALPSGIFLSTSPDTKLHARERKSFIRKPRSAEFKKSFAWRYFFCLFCSVSPQGVFMQGRN